MRDLGQLPQRLEIGGSEDNHKEEHTEMLGENSNVLAQAKAKPVDDFLI